MRSINEMVRQVAGLIDTKDVSYWENEFINSVYQRSNKGSNTTVLSSRQVEIIEEIWKKHFA